MSEPEEKITTGLLKRSLCSPEGMKEDDQPIIKNRKVVQSRIPQVDDVDPRLQRCPASMEGITFANFSPSAIHDAITEEDEENMEESPPPVNQTKESDEDKLLETPMHDMTHGRCTIPYIIEAYRNPIAELDSDTDSDDYMVPMARQTTTDSTIKGRVLTLEEEMSFSRVFSNMPHLGKAGKAAGNRDGNTIGCVDETELSTSDEYNIDYLPPKH